MDYEKEIESIKQELLSLGFDNEKIVQLFGLASEEIIDTALEELRENASDMDLDELESVLNQDVQNDQDAASKINMIFTKAYGENAETKKQEMLVSYMKDVIQKTKEAKDLYNRYQAGDPTAVASVTSQMGNPDIQELAQKLASE